MYNVIIGPKIGMKCVSPVTRVALLNNYYYSRTILRRNFPSAAICFKRYIIVIIIIRYVNEKRFD